MENNMIYSTKQDCIGRVVPRRLVVNTSPDYCDMRKG